MHTLMLDAINSPQVLSIVRPQMSEWFVADSLNNVIRDMIHLVVNVVNSTTGNVNPLQQRLQHHTALYAFISYSWLRLTNQV